MGRVTDEFDEEIKGQLSINDLFAPPERLFAVSRIFARARKNMSLNEQKAFVYGLTQFDFKEEPDKNYVMLDKKVLANVLGIHSDSDHLSVDVYNEIKDLDTHSHIELSDEDIDFDASGTVVTTIVRFKNKFRMRFNDDFLPLFTNLSTDYITMWSSDIFQMTSKRSVQFYELLRQLTDTREKVNEHGWSTKKFKDLFDIPKEGKGSYMSKDGHFLRTSFEKKVIEPLCEDIQRCSMINLVVQPDGKLYEKVKAGKKVVGYRVYWTYTAHPAVTTAQETKEIQDRVDRNPQILKVAKDIINGEKKPKKAVQKNSFNNFESSYANEDFDELEKKLLDN